MINIPDGKMCCDKEGLWLCSRLNIGTAFCNQYKEELDCTSFGLPYKCDGCIASVEVKGEQG